MTDFVVGGAVPPTSTAYIQRPFEHEVFGHLAAGDWVTLLGPRQHGKTSALVRLSDDLASEGLSPAIVDLSTFPYVGSVSDPWPAFLAWLVSQIQSSLSLETSPRHEYGDLPSALSAAFARAIGTPVLILDEASRLPSDLGPRFFSQLRSVHTAQRSGLAQTEISGLSLLFAGTFRPDTIIDDDNSPFNVSRLVHTSDLTVQDIRDLASRVATDDLSGWADRIYSEVGGQPYLVQLFLDALAASEKSLQDEAFQTALTNVAAGNDGHLPALFRRLARESGAEELVARMVAAGSAGIRTTGDGLAAFLTTVGIAKVVDFQMTARNRLYSNALDSSPSFNPDAFVQHAPPKASAVSNSGVAIAALTSEDLAWIKDEELREVVSDLHAGGLTSFHAGNYRMALAGFGAAYEGIILAIVEQLGAGARKALCSQLTLSNGKRPDQNPANCTFEGLILIAHASGQIPLIPPAVSHVARDWRNLVHPDKARREFQAESALHPEAQICAALVAKLIQHLR